MKNKIKKYWKDILTSLRRPEMAILPSSLSFFIVLSLIPTLTILVYIASLFNISIEMVIDLIDNFFPKQTVKIITDIITGKGFDTSVGIFLIVAIFIATNGTYALIRVANTLYKVDKTDYIKDRIRSVIILFIIIVLFLFLIVVPVLGNSILKALKNIKGTKNIINDILIIFNIIKWPITFIIIYFNVKLIYAISPSIRIKSNTTTYGALVTTITWIIATAIFSYYLNYFARYDVLYGNLSSIIILMMWLYLLCYIFTLGISINSKEYLLLNNKNK